MPGLVSICPPRIDAVAGDDWWFSFSLYEDGSALDVSSAIIQASVRDLTDRLAIGPIAQSSSSTGAAWSTGLVIVNIPRANTIGLTKMQYFLEINVYMNGRQHTWPYVPVEVTIATITH